MSPGPAWNSSSPILDYVLSFEHEPQFVFVLVNVEGSVERRDFFYDAKGTASTRARGSNDELGIAEPQTFTAICSDLVAAGLSHGSNCSPEAEAYLPKIRPPRPARNGNGPFGGRWPTRQALRRTLVGGALSNLHKGQIFTTADRTHSHSTKEPPDLTKREVRPRGNLNRADGCQTPPKMLSGAEADPPMHLVGLAVCLRGVIRE
jgi:hypothetical protein